MFVGLTLRNPRLLERNDLCIVLHHHESVARGHEETDARVRVDVVRFVQEIPDRSDTRRLKDQLVGAASGADLNWHAACRGRTHKEFTSKLGVVLEEADEAAECLVVIRDSRIATGGELARLCQEGHELRLIFAKATRTANENEEREKRMKKAGRQKAGRQKGRAER
jgi:four helix bundle protein